MSQPVYNDRTAVNMARPEDAAAELLQPHSVKDTPFAATGAQDPLHAVRLIAQLPVASSSDPTHREAR